MKMGMRERVFSLVSLGLLIGLFQNCGKVEFASSSSAKSEKGKIVLLHEDDNADPKNDEVIDVTNPTVSEETVVVSTHVSPSIVDSGDGSHLPPAANPPSHDEHHGNCSSSHSGSSHAGSSEDVADDNESSSDSDKIYKCVIGEKGRSRSLHFASSSSGSTYSISTSTVNLVCMTREACEHTIAGQAQQHVEAVRFEPCESNRHIVKIDESELRHLHFN